jgi:hypothetical protein
VSLLRILADFGRRAAHVRDVIYFGVMGFLWLFQVSMRMVDGGSSS